MVADDPSGGAPAQARSVGLMFDDIRAFHERYGIDKLERPGFLPADLHHFRQRFMEEELSEFKEAVESGDLVGAFDALIDLTYVVLGTAYLMGLPFDEGWRIVHEANMKKVRVDSAANSKRKSKFDVVKPAGWQPPNVGALIES